MTDPRPASRIEWIAALATEPFVLLCAVHLTVLAWRLPLFDRLPGWFYVTHPKPMTLAAWVVLTLVPLVALSLAFTLPRRGYRSLIVLILGGFAFQHALAWSEGRGLDGMRERIVRSGHAELADVAVAQRSLWAVASRYERKVQGGELGRYAHSKPPGTLLTYMATERLSRPFAAADTAAARRAALETAAAVAWPLVSYLVLVPLYGVVRRLADEETAWLACASYVLTPSTALMTLHTDQFLFPLLGMVTVWGGLEAARRRSVVAASAAGLWLWTTGFFTFPLLLMAPVMAGAIWSEAVRMHEADHRRSAVALTTRILVGTAAGLALGVVLFRLGLGYDPVARLTDARQFNALWKGWDGGTFQTLYFAWMNLLEFGLWVGMPLVVLFSGRLRRAVRQAAAGERRGLIAPALALALVLTYLAFFGQSKGETARLWLFLVPACAAMAADELRWRWGESASSVAVLALTLQWATVVLTKTGQDFF